MKEFLVKLWKNYAHFLVLGYYGVLGFTYSNFNRFIEPKYFMHSFIDDYIPFLKIFVVPYVIWYLYILVPLIYFGFKSKKDFFRLALFMFGGMSFCYVIYYFFPNGQNLRPLITDQDIFSRMILSIWGTDNPTNVAPSMHVLDSIAVHVVVIKSHLFKDKKWIHYSSLVLCILISLSTVFIKQHSIEDGLYSVILSFVIYNLIYKPWREKAEQRKKEKLALPQT